MKIVFFALTILAATATSVHAQTVSGRAPIVLPVQYEGSASPMDERLITSTYHETPSSQPPAATASSLPIYTAGYPSEVVAAPPRSYYATPQTPVTQSLGAPVVIDDGVGPCGCNPGIATTSPPPTTAANPVYPNRKMYKPLVPVRNVPAGTYIGQGLLGQPKAYVDGQPVRNFFRYVLP